MATLHIMVGLPCSGKTTRARALEAELPALRLTPDEWHLRLFGQDADAPEHDQRHGIVEGIMWEVAQRTLTLGTDVILDYGFWGREERDGLRAQARALGAGFEMHYLPVSEPELLRRLRARNADPSGRSFVISEQAMRGYMAQFQAPTEEELAQSAR